MSLPNIDNTFRQGNSLNTPTRLLLGPGPSNIPPRVNAKLISPIVGYMDPAYFQVMESTKNLLRYLFQTHNDFTIPISGAGSAAMECCLANLIEPFDVVLVFISGYFSERIYEMSVRYNANVKRAECPWGETFSLERMKEEIHKHRPKLVCLVHGETSTGVRADIGGLKHICAEVGALLMVDTVASLGGIPFFVDEWGVDACYTGGQKCLSGPPGISPITFSPKAMEKIKSRKTLVANWYLDVTLLAPYWCPEKGQARKYHHTTPTNLIYALHEALVMISEEGLENVWERHKNAAELLYKGLESIGVQPYVEPKHRLYSLTNVKVPEGVNAAEVQKYLIQNYSIEVAGGLGQFAGKILRVGLMGFNAQSPNVKLFLLAFKEAIDAQKK